MHCVRVSKLLMISSGHKGWKFPLESYWRPWSSNPSWIKIFNNSIQINPAEFDYSPTWAGLDVFMQINQNWLSKFQIWVDYHFNQAEFFDG